MRSFFASFYRVASRAGFLTAALLLGLVLWYLPSFLTLDEFRPRAQAVLESTFHCKALVGGITGQLIPSPGLVIGHVVLLEDAPTPRVLASVSAVRLSLSWKPLLKGAVEFNAIRFIRPRFIARRIPQGSRWIMLKLPSSTSSKEKVGIDAWDVRNGSVEIWDQAQKPTVKWVADQFNGSFSVREQTGMVQGKAAALGKNAIIDVHYAGADPFPIQAHLNNTRLSALQFVLPAQLFTLEGEADISLQTRFQPQTEIRAQFDQPESAGHVEAAILHGTRGPWRWSVQGKHAHLNGTVFEVPEWSAKGDEEGIAVYVRGTTTEGGMAEVGWTKSPATPEATLEVDVSSVTIRQLLQIFKAESKASPAAGASFNPYGYESWRVSQGSLKALTRPGAFVIQDAGMDVAGTHLDLTGTFDLSKLNPQAHLQGEWLNIAMPAILESFFPPPAPVTGTATMNFTLSFPLSANWMKGLNGPVQLEVKNGVLKALKTIYRISTVLNLGNYLRLRLPQVTAQGIEFETLSGHLTFQNGVLSTEDLFLKSPNMNVGMKGSVDIPGKKLDTTLRLEMFRFLEDILRDVPLTHWIFKKPNKIFLPLVVTVEGPWNDVNVR